MAFWKYKYRSCSAVITDYSPFEFRKSIILGSGAEHFTYGFRGFSYSVNRLVK
jgi:hypothetical protein